MRKCTKYPRRDLSIVFFVLFCFHENRIQESLGEEGKKYQSGELGYKEVGLLLFIYSIFAYFVPLSQCLDISSNWPGAHYVAQVRLSFLNAGITGVSCHAWRLRYPVLSITLSTVLLF